MDFLDKIRVPQEEDVHLPFCNTPSEKIWGTFPPV